MLLEPGPREWALGDERESLGLRSIEGGPHQHAAEAAAAELVGHAGVNQYEPLAVEAVDELG